MKATKKELFYNSIANEWEKVGTYKIETKKRLKVVFDDLLTDVDLKGRKFLDAGCGLGYFSEIAFSKKVKLTGVDVGNKLVMKCSKKLPKGKFVEGLVTDLPFKDKSFDIVLCTEVIEHVEDPIKAVSELFRVTKPGGYIVLTTPNKLFKPLFDFLSLTKIRKYQGNENWVSPWNLKKIIKKQGGNIKKEKHFNFIYPHKLLDKFEQLGMFQYLMINQGYLVQKIDNRKNKN